MVLFQNRPATLHANRCNGPADMGLKMSLSLREIVDASRRVSAPPAPYVTSITQGPLLCLRQRKLSNRLPRRSTVS